MLLNTNPFYTMTTATQATPSLLVQNLLAQYPPLETVTRTHVDTNAAAHYMNRRPQTLRGWHCGGDYPIESLRPITVNGRLLWSVTAIKKCMGVSA